MTPKPENLINAACELFMSRPYHKVTMDDVRHRAGVGKGTLYRHFQSKEDLYCHVVLHELDRLVASLRETGAEEHAGPRMRIRKLSRRLAGFFEGKKALFALLRSEELRASQAKKTLFRQWKERRSRLIEIFEEAIGEGVACGEYSPDIPPRIAATFLLAMLKSGRRGPDGGGPENDSRAEYALLLFENGMVDDARR